ncbi:MAG: orotidine 5'-phosphate decarboxylase / HUMPS family protein [archaeon]
MDLIKPPGIIVALDISLSESCALVQKLKPAEDKIAGYKVSSLTVLEHGLNAIVAELKKFTKKPIIYDHQKGCTDIPKIVEKQVKLAADCGINSFIAVPLGAGSETMAAFVNACKEKEILPIILLSMTHKGAEDYLKPEAPDLVFETARDLGVKYFVAPGNNPEKIAEIKAKLDPGMFITSPGIGAQGGSCEEAVKAGTDYPIVGRAVYEAEDSVKAVEALYKEARKGFESR